MPDTKKVIKAIDICLGHGKCNDCSYHSGANYSDQNCRGRMLQDVLALLKEQEAKTGYWIDSAGNDKCSICGEEYSDLYPDYGNTHFCPNCGAKMKGREVNG